MQIQELIEITVNRNASDLHLISGSPPIIRVDSVLLPVPGQPILTPSETERLISQLLRPDQKELLVGNRELDFSYEYKEGARFRINAYYQRNSLAAAFRYLPSKIGTVEELSLPKICHDFASLRQGFILVTGPTGHGKSTSVASMINEINTQKAAHIVTIEDPVEYVYPQGKAIISQREMQGDTHSWSTALKSALREDPDVVLIGEMRDFETISSALTIAETGHLVFATLHTNDAAQSVDRIVDVFPQSQQQQARMQFANVLEGIVSLRLVPRIKGGRVPVCEILVATSAVRTAIREGKSHLIPNIIQTSGEVGMIPLDKSFAHLVSRGEISLETAQEYSLHPEEVMRLVKNS